MERPDAENKNNLPFPNLILFDWHGTLVNTHDAMYQAVEEMLAQLDELDLIRHLRPEQEAKTEDDEKLLRYSDDGSTLSAVDFPEVSLPPHTGDARLLHVHENRPGIMSSITEVIGRSSANIDAQYLQTLGDVGYVVTDVAADRQAARSLMAELRRLEGTLRTRVLF